MSGDRVRFKFEGFQVGDRIKAYDFKPCEGREERYVAGRIIEVDAWRQGAIGYLIQVEEDTACPPGYRTRVFVPYEISLLEFDERVTLLKPH